MLPEEIIIAPVVTEKSEAAKSEGKYKGKPKKNIDREHFEKVCKQWRQGDIRILQRLHQRRRYYIPEQRHQGGTLYRRRKDMDREMDIPIPRCQQEQREGDTDR